MKNKFLVGIIVGVLFPTIIAATAISSDLITIKPAVPKSSRCFYTSATGAVELYNTYSAKGYVVEIISINPNTRKDDYEKSYVIIKKY